MNQAFLYKDTGSIAMALSKYHNWKTTFAYLDICGDIKDKTYEQYVELKPICFNENKLKKWINIVSFIWRESKENDVINFYFGGRSELLLALISKMSNSKIKVYIKMDLVKEKYLRQVNLENRLTIKFLQIFSCLLSNVVDLYTVECKAYIEGLNKIKRFNGKVKYLPNGYFSDLVEIDSYVKKEKIILTVGRLGTRQKNTEMLVEAIESIDPQKLVGWEIYLVGSMTDDFKKWFKEKIERNQYLKEIFICTGNISNKRELYNIYAKSSVFVLTSRWESWGLVVTESMGFACYPIVTDCCDAFYEIISSDEEGLAKIIPNEDVKSLKEAIEQVVDNRIDYLQKGKKVKAYAEKNLEWKTITKLLDKYLNFI